MLAESSELIAGVHFEIAECKLMRQKGCATLWYIMFTVFYGVIKTRYYLFSVRIDTMGTNLLVNMF